MHVLVTGAAGLIGSHVMVALLDQGHTILATDINPLPPNVKDQIADRSERVQEMTGDLTNVKFIDELFDSTRIPFDGVMHIGGVRSPVGLDPRLVHNINVVATYNVLQTAASRGITRIVQASSCNALGLSWTSAEHWRLDSVPINEQSPMRPEDPYSLSKLICEEQAAAIHRYYPEVRIASIRMHFTRSSVNETTSSVKHTGLWSWSSVDAVLRACILALTSDGWTGAEAFHIAADEIFYPASMSNGVKVPALELLEKHWPDRVKNVDKSWWEGNPRRSFFDTSKAQRVLGWSHDL
ncbi:hypothetical protein I317_06712 [Kwoniella heveanensis CBS 569]|uniref:NAD-dependent epimerase/dehydratase domain-containing protein n=1 Tax=Kwoniella heveanensis BCC8398 TaxID=1296120 RepID=A0A1B9GLV7_9TREE|nr:hypothetical protein I316_06388 [Kwoniella heveanensis BCC8398]OCF39494.1 hypothetical protein I317_06712 [Kwoniella heveanensis CBS 569]